MTRTMALPSLVAKIVGWLRSGYPNGVPERDYLRLFAYVRRVSYGLSRPEARNGPPGS
jgi:hypothetical protein